MALNEVQRSKNSVAMFFSDTVMAGPKRLVIEEKDGVRYLKVVKAGQVSLLHRILAYLFGIGPASFKQVMQYCIDHNIWHEKIKNKVIAYNTNRVSYKKVNEAVLLILPPKPTPKETPKEKSLPKVELEKIGKSKAVAVDEGMFMSVSASVCQDIDKQELYFEIRDELGRNELMNACIENNLEKVKTILAVPLKGKELSYEDKAGYTALMHAAEKKAELIIEALRAAGASPFEKSSKGLAALQLSINSRDFSTAKILIGKKTALESKASEEL